MTAYWLAKQEPTAYSWSDLERDGATEWNGVHNALALRHLRSMAEGDLSCSTTRATNARASG